MLTERNVVDNLTSVSEWGDAKVLFPDGRLVRAHTILGIKHFERPEEWAWKARIVAGGNNVRDTSGCKVVDAMATSAPATLDEVRIVLAVGATQPSFCAIAADVDAAYLHAELVGPPHLLALPREAWPPSWAKARYTCPVVRLRRTLPGLQQSGPLWNEYCGRVLLGRGWSKVLDVAADIWVKHVGSTLVILLVYVDDLLVV